MFERHKGKCLIIAAVMCCVIYMLWVAVEDKYDAYAYDQELRFIPLDDDFRDEQGLVYSLNEDIEHQTARVIAYSKESEGVHDVLYIPESVFYNRTEYIVETVDFDSFADAEIELVKVSDTVKNYENIDNSDILIKSIYIGENCEEIDYENFYKWSRLQDIYVSADNIMYTTTEGILYDVKQEKLLAVPSNRIDDKLCLPDTVISIGKNAFKNSKIKTVENMKGLSIGNSAFENSAINNIDINTVIDIGYRAFYNCQYINNLLFFDKVHIGEQAFYNCNSLKCLYLPGDITIDNSAFCYCRNLEVVAIGEGNGIGKVLSVQGNGEFFNCPNVNSVYFPDTMEVIDGAFNTIDSYNYKIKRLYIPKKNGFNYRRFCQPIINMGNYQQIENVFYGDLIDPTKYQTSSEVLYSDSYGILVADVCVAFPRACNFRYYVGMQPVQFEENRIFNIYGQGEVYVFEDEYDGSILGTNVQGIAIPLGITIPHKAKVKVYVDYVSEEPMRIWLSNQELEGLSEAQRLISRVPVVLTNNVTEGYQDSDYLIIKAKNYLHIVNQVLIEGIYIQVLEEDDTQETVYPEIMPENSDVCEMPLKLYDIEATKHDAYTYNEDMGFTVSWTKSSEKKYKGCMLRFEEPKNLNEYNYMVVDAAGQKNYYVTVRDYYHIDQYGSEIIVGSEGEVVLPAVFNLSEIKNEGMDYSSVIAVAIRPENDDVQEKMNICSVKFYKNEEDIPVFTAKKTVVTAKPTMTPRPTATVKPTATIKPAATVKPIATPANTPNVTATPIIHNDLGVGNQQIVQTVTKKPQTADEKNVMKRPVIKVTKGKLSNGIRYVKIRLKKYSGKYIQIYAGSNSSMKRIKLSSKKIKAKNPSFKLKYTKRNTTIYIKVRTYYKKANKKIYSKYSVIKKIKV